MIRVLLLIVSALAVTIVGAYFFSHVGVYLLFTAVSFAVLYCGVFLSFQYSHFFLSIMWFVGFWLKSAVHYVLDVPYCEPVGAFDGSLRAWNDILLVVSIGGLGYLGGRMLMLPAVRAAGRTGGTELPCWYRRVRTLLWLSVGLVLIVTILVNQEMGLIVRGYVAKVQLPWPLGGLFAWTTDIGLALVISVLAAWDRASGAGVLRGFVVLCIEGAMVSVATLSRGLYFFHTLPAVVSEASSSTSTPALRRQIAGLLLIWLAVAICVPLVATGLRLIGDNAIPTNQARMDAETGAASSAPPAASIDVRCNVNEPWSVETIVRKSISIARALVIDRWTGLEGAMAAETYPARHWTLFVEAAAFRRTYGVVDVYTERISNSGFTAANAKKYHFATLAGPIAFFDFSGSWLVVFAGMAALAALMSFFEIVWTLLVRDPLVISMSGCYLALVALQLSGGIVQALSGPLAVTVVLAFVWLISRISPGSCSTLELPKRIR